MLFILIFNLLQVFPVITLVVTLSSVPTTLWLALLEKAKFPLSLMYAQLRKNILVRTSDLKQLCNDLLFSFSYPLPNMKFQCTNQTEIITFSFKKLDSMCFKNALKRAGSLKFKLSLFKSMNQFLSISKDSKGNPLL